MLLWRYLHQDLTDDDAMDYNEGIDRSVETGTDNPSNYSFMHKKMNDFPTIRGPEIEKQ